jgi:hypothetical protein
MCNTGSKTQSAKIRTASNMYLCQHGTGKPEKCNVLCLVISVISIQECYMNISVIYTGLESCGYVLVAVLV